MKASHKTILRVKVRVLQFVDTSWLKSKIHIQGSGLLDIILSFLLHTQTYTIVVGYHFTNPIVNTIYIPCRK